MKSKYWDYDYFTKGGDFMELLGPSRTPPPGELKELVDGHIQAEPEVKFEETKGGMIVVNKPNGDIVVMDDGGRVVPLVGGG